MHQLKIINIMDLFDSIRKGDLDAVKMALTNNPDLLEKPDQRGFSPLIMATYSGQIEIAEFIINTGVDVNAKDSAGNTALMGVCFKGSIEMVELLLTQNVDINLQNSKGATALIYATMFDQQEITLKLIELGANKTIKDESGQTAYTHAQLKGNRTLMDLLKN